MSNAHSQSLSWLIPVCQLEPLGNSSALVELYKVHLVWLLVYCQLTACAEWCHIHCHVSGEPQPALVPEPDDDQSLMKNTMAWHGAVGREEGRQEFMWVLHAPPHPMPTCADTWSHRMLLMDTVGNPTSVLRRAGEHQRGRGTLVGHMVHQFTLGFIGQCGTGSGTHLRGVGHIQKGRVICDEVRAVQGTSGVVVACQEGLGCVQCIVCTCGMLRVRGYMITGLACVQEGVWVHVLGCCPHGCHLSLPCCCLS